MQRAAVVGPVGQPCAADESRLAVEELAVGALPVADDGTLPLPGPLLVGKPVLAGDHLLDGEAGDAASEEGEEAELQTALLHVGRTFQKVLFHNSDSDSFVSFASDPFPGNGSGLCFRAAAPGSISGLRLRTMLSAVPSAALQDVLFCRARCVRHAAFPGRVLTQRYDFSV